MQSFKKLMLVSLMSFFWSNIGLAVQLTHEQYVELTKKNTGRCVSSISAAACNEEIDYAVAEGMITKDTGNWAKGAGYFPVFSKRGKAIGGVCQCGCFAEGTKLLTNAGWQAVEELTNASEVVALNRNASLKRPDFDIRAFKSVISGAEKAALFVFTTEHDHELKVTQHHGMVLANGQMKAAKDVKVGDEFVTLDGVASKVVQIDREYTSRHVWNLEVATDSKKEHVVVANGLIVGDLAWQNQLKKDLTSISLRK